MDDQRRDQVCLFCRRPVPPFTGEFVCACGARWTNEDADEPGAEPPAQPRDPSRL